MMTNPDQSDEISSGRYLFHHKPTGELLSCKNISELKQKVSSLRKEGARIYHLNVLKEMANQKQTRSYGLLEKNEYFKY